MGLSQISDVAVRTCYYCLLKNNIFYIFIIIIIYFFIIIFAIKTCSFPTHFDFCVVYL